METSDLERVRELAAVAVARARAEAAEWAAILQYEDRLQAEYATTEPYFLRRAQVASIALEIANAMQLSEGQVHRRLACAKTLRDQAPIVWSAFRRGAVDAQRAVMISDSIDKLQRPASIDTLDAKVVAYAETHTGVELRSWLRKFVTRVEADLFIERAEAERQQRRVEISHGDDAMSWLTAYLPSHMAAAIDNRLRREARAMTHDDRSMAQRRVDLLISWATCTENGEPAIGADIAVVIPAETLVGLSDAPAVSADGTFIVPAHWITDAARNPFWHKLVVDIDGNVLEHLYLGRTAPAILDKALQFTYGTCQAPTCTKPAQHCENDHRRPWPHGPTRGANMWPLCPRHHRMKTHDVIRWVLPSGTQVDAEPVDHRHRVDLVSPLEHRFARCIEYAA